MTKMNVYRVISATVLISPLIITAQDILKPTKTHIKLDSPILHTVDGTTIGVNGDVVRLIMYVRREINMQLFGKHAPDGSYTGLYTFENKKHTIQELVTIEEQIIAQGTQSQRQELATLLQTVKHDFITKVHPFMENARNSKRIMTILIEESCAKRSIEENSLLVRWADSKSEAEELVIFSEEIHSFVLFNRFCCDLLNFLGDLVISCPKGVEQFKQSCEKRDKVLALLPQLTGIRSVRSEKREKLQHDFAHYVFTEHLNKLTTAEITPARLEMLLEQFEYK